MKNLAKNKKEKQLKLVVNRDAEDNSAIRKFNNKTTQYFLFCVVFLSFFLTLIFSPVPAFAQTNQKVLVVPVSGEIDNGLSFFLQRQLRRAEKEGYSAVVLEVNSNGGLVNSAQEMKDALLKSKVKTIAFVNGRALSAAALVSIACHNIYMAPGSEMGAATPIMLIGSGVKAAEPKFVSAFEAEFGATAEARNREPALAKAMVNPNHDTIEDLCPKGEILTLTAEKAFKHGYCDQITASITAVLRVASLENAEVENVAPTSSEIIARYLTNPTVSTLLFTIAFWCMVIEFYIPGFGIFGIVSIVCFALFFGGHLFAYMAGFEVMIVFVIGLVLLLLEIFVIPGFGITGISGILCLCYSIIQLYGGFFEAIHAIGYLLLYTTIAVTLIYKLAPKIGLFDKLVLKKEMTAESGYVAVSQDAYSDLIGLQGVTLSICRPSGKAKIGTERYDVVSEGDFIEKGEQIMVKKVDGNKIVIKKLEV
jgi:membrane-bound serine protease (ClpP class)